MQDLKNKKIKILKKPIDKIKICDIIYKYEKNAPLAQLDRVFGYEPKGRGFESLTACQKNEGGNFHLRFFAMP